jgi:hypothetical protein
MNRDAASITTDSVAGISNKDVTVDGARPVYFVDLMLCKSDQLCANASMVFSCCIMQGIFTPLYSKKSSGGIY